MFNCDSPLPENTSGCSPFYRILHRDNVKLFFVHFFIPIAGGTWIYLLFRSEQLLVFHWLSALNLYDFVLQLRNYIDLKNLVPSWVVYSLPNGLWAYSFMFFIAYIWRKEKRAEKIFFVLLVIALSLGSELGQLLNVVPGTFCLVDFLLYAAGLSLGYVVGNNYTKGELPDEDRQIC